MYIIGKGMSYLLNYGYGEAHWYPDIVCGAGRAVTA